MTALKLHAMICIIGFTMVIHVRGNAGLVSRDNQYTGSNIGTGVGYSQDTQQLTAQRCYDATVESVSGEQSYVQLSRAITSKELEKKMGISLGGTASIKQFSIESKTSYIRTIQDNECSISLNYYRYASNEVDVHITGNRALTEAGKRFYKSGKNKYFGLVCGDYYISSYQQGAFLTMGLYLKFRSSVDKTEFEKSAGVEFGDILKASQKIKYVSNKQKLNGSIIIQAFQIGGEPSRLSKLLNKDAAGNFYALTCNFAAMDNCGKTAKGLLDYVTNDFEKQFSFKNNTGITPLGDSFSDYQPISWIGLSVPATFVTKDVIKYRQELSSKIKETKYYQEKLYPFLNKGYPVKVDNVLFNAAEAILSKANENMQIIMQPHGGAADCFNFPDDCKNIRDRIYSQLQNITISDLTIFNNIKYRIRMSHGVWYNSGEDSKSSWMFKPRDSNSMYTLMNVEVTDKNFSYCLGTDPKNTKKKECFQGSVKSDPTKYEGEIWINNKFDSKAVATKQHSLFFFQAYNKLNGTNNNRMKIKLRLVVNHP